MCAYQGLLFNDGAIQREVSHHGYIYFLMLSFWYQIADLIGLIPISSVSDLTASPDTIEVFGDAIVAGRFLSITLGVVLSGLFFILTLLLTRNWMVALVVGAIFALGEGNAYQTISMRTELPATLFLCLAFLSLIKATATEEWRVHAWLASAGFFSSLAYNTKLQAMFLLLAFPLLALAFGRPRRGNTLVGLDLSNRQTALIIIGLLLPVSPAWTMLLGSLGQISGNLSFVYVPAIIAFCFACIICYGRLYGVPCREWAIASAAVVFGFGVGLSLLFIHRHPLLFAIDANPLEHMSRYVLDASVKTKLNDLGQSSERLLLASLKHTWLLWFGGSPLENAYRLLLWITATGAVVLAAISRGRAAVQVILLIAQVSLMYGISSIRYGQFSQVYSIYLDIWILLAFAIVAAELSGKRARAFRPAIAGFIIIVSGMVVTRNIELGIVDWSQPKSNICVQANGYLPATLAEAFHPLCNKK